MELYKHLVKREQDGNLIKVGLVGCGQMGSGLLHVTKGMKGIETYAVSDIDVNRPLKELSLMGIDKSDIVITEKLSIANDAIIKGKYVVTPDAMLLANMETLDNVIEATGNTEIGAKVAWTRVTNGLDMVMLNVETDVTVGLLLSTIAKKNGSVYTVAAGDEPAVCKMLYDFSRTLGFEVVCLGKGKNNPVNVYCTPEMCVEEAASKNMNPKMLCSFIDGTKTMVEMAAVSNATGLLPDVAGMHGPKIEISELVNTFIPEADGGILSTSGCVDYSTGKVAPGVFAIVKSQDERIISDMQFLSMGKGPYFMFYRPFHLCNIETPIAVAEAAIYREITVVAQSMNSEVVSIAKRDLAPGDRLGTIGGNDFFNMITKYSDAKAKHYVPMGVTPGSIVTKHIKKGENITFDAIKPDPNSFVWKLRTIQDDMMVLGR